MTTSHPYPHYRDSGVSWLGQVPVNWRVKRFRYLFSESSEKITDGIVGPMLSVSGYRGVEVKSYDDDNRRRLEEELIGYRIVRPGQLVVNTMWLNYAGLGVSAFEGHVSPAYRAYNFAHELHDRYAHHLLRSSIYVQGYTQLLTGIRPNSLQMSREDLMRFPVVIPPLREQIAIASFLDRETGKIDALVEEQRRLIELLREKRQAVISRAVTRGLNSDAAMKHTGVEWLGQVPEHWNITTVKHLGSIRYGIGEPPPYRETGTPLIRATNVHEGRIYDDGLVFVDPDDIPDSKVVWLTAGDIIVVRSGAYTGDSAIIPPDFGPAIAGFDMVFRPGLANPDFLQFTFLSTYVKTAQIDQMRVRAAQPHLNADELGRCIILLPPPSEQEAIAKHLQMNTLAIDKLIDEATVGIALLNERRAALISAAVTGKIDVRRFVDAQEAAE